MEKPLRLRRPGRFLRSLILLAAGACGDDLGPLDPPGGGTLPDAVAPSDAAALPDAALPDGPAPDGAPATLTYSNPTRIEIPGTARTVENCPDPSIIRTHHLGSGAKIGLVSMARPYDLADYAGDFDYVRVYELGGDGAAVADPTGGRDFMNR